MTEKLLRLPLILAFVIFAGCKTGQPDSSSVPTAGLFKVAILYPNGDEKTFNMDYYEKKHMPMVAEHLGKNLQFYEIDKGLSGRTPTDKAPFVAIGYFYVSNIAAYNKAVAENREAIVGDFKNYTNIQPVVQISEIRQVVRHGLN